MELDELFTEQLNKTLALNNQKKLLQESIDYSLKYGLDHLKKDLDLANFVALVVANNLPKKTAKKVADGFDLAALTVKKSRGKYATPYVWSNGKGYVYGTDGTIATRAVYNLPEGWYCPTTRASIGYNMTPPAFDRVIDTETVPLFEPSYEYVLQHKTAIITVRGVSADMYTKYKISVTKDLLHQYVGTITNLSITRDLIKFNHTNHNATTVVMGTRDSYAEELL